MKRICLIAGIAMLFPPYAYADNSTDPIPAKKMLPTEYQTRMAIFPPWHQVYERIKPNDFYIGIEGWITWAFRSGTDFYNAYENRYIDNKDRFVFIGEAEIRGGYNFFYNGRDHFTPILGGGVFKDWATYYVYESGWNNEGSYYYESPKYRLPLLGYGMTGFLYNHDFNSVFNLGINLKGIIGGGITSEHMRWGSVVVGFDIALPITFRFGNRRQWDVRLEPFNIYLHGSDNARNYIGGRSTIAYYF